MTVLLSTAYWPNLHYFYYVLKYDVICIEQYEHYQKQSYRNRTRILTANGPMYMSVPVKKKAPKELIKDVEISYAENWQARHWRALTSAYNNSPYFEFFEDEIGYFYRQPFGNLLQFNLAQLELVLKLLRMNKLPELTSLYQEEATHAADAREKIHPKRSYTADTLPARLLEQPYYQTFDAKFGFTPNLSILDLLFNKGMETLDYFKDR